jgi:hypothetical protein
MAQVVVYLLGKALRSNLSTAREKVDDLSLLLLFLLLSLLPFSPILSSLCTFFLFLIFPSFRLRVSGKRGKLQVPQCLCRGTVGLADWLDVKGEGTAAVES